MSTQLSVRSEAFFASAPLRQAPAAAVVLLSVAGLAAVVYGVVGTGLLGKPAWHPADGWELAAIAGAVALPGLLGLLVRGGRYRRTVPTLAFLAFAVASAGALPVATVLLVLLACFCLGDLLFGRMLTSAQATGDATAAETSVLAVLAGLVCYDAAVNLAAHFPVNGRWTYLAALLAPILVNRRACGRLLALLGHAVGPARPLREEERIGPAVVSYVLGMVTLLVLVMHWAWALIPERYPDALAVHLFLPSQIAIQGSWSFDFVDFMYALMPAGGDWTYAIAYLLGGETAVKLINFALLGAGLTMLGGALGRIVPGWLAMLLVAATASMPLSFLLTASAFIEHQLAALLLAAVVAAGMAWRRPTAGCIVLVALLLGGAALTKLHALCAIAPTAVAVGIAACRRAGPARGLGLIALASVVGLTVGGTPYVYAWIVSGNPVFPFFNDVFKSPFLPPVPFPAGYQDGLGWLTPYTLTFSSSRHIEGGDGVLGLLPLLLMPAGLAAALLGRQSVPRIAAAVFLCYFLGVMSGSQYARYLYPILPVGMLLAASLFAWLDGAGSWIAGVLRRTLVLAAAVAVPINVLLAPAGGWIVSGFPGEALFHADARLELVKAQVPARALIDLYNETSGAKDRLAIFGAPVGVGLADGIKQPPVFGNWYNSPFTIAAAGAKSAASALRVLEAHGVSHLLVTPSDPYLQGRGMQEVLARHVRPVSSLGSVTLYALERDPPNGK